MTICVVVTLEGEVVNTCVSDIHSCEVCGQLLEYAVDDEGESLADTPAICVQDGIVYRVDMATGELVRTGEAVPVGWGAP